MSTAAQVTFDSYKDIPGYIINLDKDVFRYKQTHSRLTELGFTNISRWRATDYREEDVNTEIRRFGAGHLERFKTDAEIACVLSHFRVMLHFLSGSNPYCLIFEDDVIAHEDFKELSSFPDIRYGDFDLLNFGGIFIAPKPDTGYLDFSTYKTSLGDSASTHMDNVHVWQIHAYLITREFAFKAIHRYAEWTCSNDHHYPQTDEYFFRAPWFNTKTLIGTPSKYTHKYRLNKNFGRNICGILMQDNSYSSNIQQEETKISDITFIIAAQIDSQDRLDNLQITLSKVTRDFSGCEVLLLESATGSKISVTSFEQVKKIFIPLVDGEVFNKMRLYNIGARQATGSVLCFVDVDVPPSKKAVTAAYNKIVSGESDVVYPYATGKGYNVPKELHTLVLNNEDFFAFDPTAVPWLSSCEEMSYVESGGIFLVDTSKYKQAGGGNENFIGWGCEDDEMLSRFSGLSYKIGRIDDAILLHLKHDRGTNPLWYDYSKYERANRVRLACVRNMNKLELESMVKSWDNFTITCKKTDNLTVIISGSYLDSHPSINFMREVIESLELTGLPHNTPLILSHDKIKPGTEGAEEKEKAYQEYFKNLEEYVKNSQFKNITISRAPEWGHLTRTLKHAVSQVKTKYILVLQHDIHIRREIPVLQMIDLMERQQHIKHLRFNVRKNLPTFMWWDGYKDGTRVFAEEEYDGVKLCVTPAWSDQNHLATKEYYEQIVFPDCTNPDGELIYDFMENRMNGLCHHNHSRYGTYIYGEYGAPRTSRHSDGRKSSPEPDED